MRIYLCALVAGLATVVESNNLAGLARVETQHRLQHRLQHQQFVQQYKNCKQGLNHANGDFFTYYYADPVAKVGDATQQYCTAQNVKEFFGRRKLRAWGRMGINANYAAQDSCIPTGVSESQKKKIKDLLYNLAKGAMKHNHILTDILSSHLGLRTISSVCAVARMNGHTFDHVLVGNFVRLIQHAKHKQVGNKVQCKMLKAPTKPIIQMCPGQPALISVSENARESVVNKMTIVDPENTKDTAGFQFARLPQMDGNKFGLYYTEKLTGKVTLAHTENGVVEFKCDRKLCLEATKLYAVYPLTSGAANSHCLPPLKSNECVIEVVIDKHLAQWTAKTSHSRRRLLSGGNRRGNCRL